MYELDEVQTLLTTDDSELEEMTITDYLELVQDEDFKDL